MLQLSCFKLLKITIGNNFCFLTACKTVVFPLKLVFQGARVVVLTVHKNTGCFAVLFFIKTNNEGEWLYILKALCTLLL